MGTRANPVEGVDVILIKPDGTEGDTRRPRPTGSSPSRVTESGDYLVGIDESTMPKGIELNKPRNDRRAPFGEGDTYKVDNIDLRAR